MDFNCLKIGDEYKINFFIHAKDGNLLDVVSNITVTPDLSIVNIASKSNPISVNPVVNIGTIQVNKTATITVTVAIVSIENLVDDNYKITLSTTTSTTQNTADDTLSKNLHKEFNFFERCDQQLSVTDLDPTYELVNAPDGLRVDKVGPGYPVPTSLGTSNIVVPFSYSSFEFTVSGNENEVYLATIQDVGQNGKARFVNSASMLAGQNAAVLVAGMPYTISAPNGAGWPDGDTDVTIIANGYSETFTVTWTAP